MAKLNHTNIVSYKAAWIEVARIEVPSFLCSPLKDRKSHKLCASNYTEESKSYNLHSTKDSYSNGNSLYALIINKIYHLIRKITCVTDMCTDMKVKQQNRKRRSTGGFSQNVSERFEELNSFEVIEDRIVEDNVAKHTEEAYSDIVSFRNSKKSKNSNESKDSNSYTDHNYLCEESSSQEICTYTSKVSR